MKSQSTPGPRWPAAGGSEEGFTLLETLVALVVLGLAVVLSIQALARGVEAQTGVRRHLEAAALAETRMSEMALLSADSLDAYASPREGRFDAPFQRYTWRAMTRTTPAAPRLVEVAVVVEWPAGSFALETALFRPERVAPVMGGVR